MRIARALCQVRDEGISHDAPLKLWRQNSDLMRDKEVTLFCLKLENRLSSRTEDVHKSSRTLRISTGATLWDPPPVTHESAPHH